MPRERGGGRVIRIFDESGIDPSTYKITSSGIVEVATNFFKGLGRRRLPISKGGYKATKVAESDGSMGRSGVGDHPADEGGG